MQFYSKNDRARKARIDDQSKRGREIAEQRRLEKLADELLGDDFILDDGHTWEPPSE